MTSTLIQNGKVITADGAFNADLRLAEGRIVDLTPGLLPQGAEEVIDASGCFVIPGAVDAHTHFNLTVGENQVADGWETAGRAAALGGTTTVIEHPGFGPAACSLRHQLTEYLKSAKSVMPIDYGLHGVFQHFSDAAVVEVKRAVENGFPSFKAYLTYDGRLTEEEFLKAAKALKDNGGLMTVHAENHTLVTYLSGQLKQNAPEQAFSHPQSRPDYVEALAVCTAIDLCRASGAPLYIVHLSSRLGLLAIQAAQAEGLPVWAETCPQYLYLTDEVYQNSFDEALKYVMSPTPKKEKDREALWQALLDGSISVVATDHCNFSWAQKRKLAGGNIFKSPGGVPGAEMRLAFMYSEGVLKRGLSLSRWVELCATAPARLFGLTKKGTLDLGADADVVIFDPVAKKNISAEILHGVDYTPFQGLDITGWPRDVFLRGQKIVEKGVFVGPKGGGQFVSRQKFNFTLK